MPLVGGMHLPFCLLPYLWVDGGEPGVCLWGGSIHLGEAEPMGEGERLMIHAVASDDVDLLLGIAVAEGLLEGGIDFGSRAGDALTGEDDVAPVGQGTLGQRLEGLAPHHDGMPRGEGLEALQVVGEMKQQLVVEADGPVAVYGGDNGYHGSQFSMDYTDTCPAMCGWGL